jgi:hypothetical protein
VRSFYGDVRLTILYRKKKQKNFRSQSHIDDSRLMVYGFCVLQDLKDFMRKGGEVIYADAHKLRPNEG